MRSRKPLVPLGLLLILLAACGKPAGDAGKAADTPFVFAEPTGDDCTLAAAWDRVLELGLRRDAESATQLASLKARKECAAEIRKVAEVLLDDRIAEHTQHPETAVKVRFQDPDLRSLHLKKQPSQAIVLEATIDAQGRVKNAELLQPHSDPKVNEVFLAAARGWLFRPARQGDGWVESKQSFSANVHIR